MHLLGKYNNKNNKNKNIIIIKKINQLRTTTYLLTSEKKMDILDLHTLGFVINN
jgi:hypothetical protein